MQFGGKVFSLTCSWFLPLLPFYYLCGNSVDKMETIKRNISGILIALLACAILSGCSGLSKVKDIKVTSCGLESYSLKGLRSVDAVLAVGIDNPTFAFKILNVSGTVKYKGEDFATYTADSVSVDKKCMKVYDVPCTATLDDGISLKRLMLIAKKGSLEGFTTDVTATVRLKSGAGTTLRFKDVDLNKMTE